MNEAELFAALEEYSFEKVFLEDYALEEQARLFDSAECVVGFHGAGLTNIMFCRPGTRIVEIFSPDFIVTNFWTFSEQIGLRYYCYCEDEHYTGVHGGRFQRVVELNISVPAFMHFFAQVASSLAEENKSNVSHGAAVGIGN